ncbi:11073_t:CDS:2, partial [Racocetra fulgida]
MVDNIDNRDYDNLGPDIVVSSPLRQSVYINNIQSAMALKKQLQEQLNENANKIQMTAELGAALVKQQTELESQIQDLDKTHGDEVPQELKNKLIDLEKTARTLDANAAKVFLGTKGLTEIDPDENSLNVTPATTPAVAGSKLSRRERNNAKGRQKDIEFATEIGQGLLIEVRRLQALLQEKDERIKELEIDKSELERTIEQLNKTIRTNKESEERLNEQIWTLELTRQELSNQIEELQQQLVRARIDYTKIEKALSTATDVIEQLKDKEEKLTINVENLRARHEQDMANNRRHIAALNREKTDLSKTIEDLESQLECLVNASRIKKKPGVASNDLYYDENGQVINDLNGTHPGIPIALQNKNLNVEVETLKALNAANRMIGNLRANLQKEKSEKYELRKLLADSQEQIEAIRNAEFDVPVPNKRRIQQNQSNMGLSNIIENTELSRDDEFGEDYQHRDGYSSEEYTIYSEEDIINKSTRPSSDWFNTRRSNTLSRSSRTSRISSQASSLFQKRSRADESISDVEEEENEDMIETKISEAPKIDKDISCKDEEDTVKAQRAEALRKLDENSSTRSRISVNINKPETLEDIFGNYRRESIAQRNEDEDASTNRDSKVESVVHRSDIENSTYENTEYSDEPKTPKDEKIDTYTSEQGEIILNIERDDDDDASSADSFASANETNVDSKRESSSSKRDSKRGSDISKRDSKRGSDLFKSDFKRVSRHDVSVSTSGEPIAPIKTFKDAEVQTEPTEPSEPELQRNYSISSKFTFGNRETMVFENVIHNPNEDSTSTHQSALYIPDNNNIDKRFTLDLSSSLNNQRDNKPSADTNKNVEVIDSRINSDDRPHSALQSSYKHQVNSLDPPPRPTSEPLQAPITHMQRPTYVDFGQQAGTPKVPHPLNAQGHRGSTDSTNLARGVNDNSIKDTNSVTTRHRHTTSSDSISSVSSNSSSIEPVSHQSDSSYVEPSGPMPGRSGTDPRIIQAITQTMIGEYLWKYTRRNFGTGISEKRHKRFFWVHPYTKTLYWSNKDPGTYEPVDPKSKSGMSYFAYIESVKQVVDNNPSPSGLHHMSLVIKTPERELKFTAPTKERHEYWYQALTYLLLRPDETGQIPGRPGKIASDPWENQNIRDLHNTSPNGSLRGNNLREIKKKSSFSKLQSMFRRQDTLSPPSPLSSEFTDGQPAVQGHSHNDLDHNEFDNVRQCCDGQHDISRLE